MNPNNKGQVGVQTIKAVKKGAMLYIKYNDNTHYWKIQWKRCKAGIQDAGGRTRKGLPNTENDDNDLLCFSCNRRGELIMCDTCYKSRCEKCLSQKEIHLLHVGNFFCETCLDKPIKHPNRFAQKKKRRVTYNSSSIDKEKKWLEWLEHESHNYCTTYNGFFDLHEEWKKDKGGVLKLFKKVTQKKLLANIEFLNLKGSNANSNGQKWGVEIVESLIQMISRENSHVYGLNLGEIYFTVEALVYLHENLHRTLVGWIFIETDYNVLPKGCFRHTNTIDTNIYPNGSNLVANRKEKPIWYKRGEIAPWYDGVDNTELLNRDETMKKCFFGSINSKNYNR